MENVFENIGQNTKKQDDILYFRTFGYSYGNVPIKYFAFLPKADKNKLISGLCFKGFLTILGYET